MAGPQGVNATICAKPALRQHPQLPMAPARQANAQSDEIVHWLDEPGPWVIEGAAVVRALRKWLRSHPEGLPFDQLIYLTKPMIESTYWQRVMAKGAHTIWNEIEPVINQRLAGQIINLR